MPYQRLLGTGKFIKYTAFKTIKMMCIYIYIYMGVSILYPKYMKKMGSELTGKFLQKWFFAPMDYFFDFGIENYIENPEISTKFRSKSSVERPKQAKSIIFLAFSRKKSIQISSGLASPYWNATAIPPGSHPSLLAVYTLNIGHLNMQHLHPSHFSLWYSQSLYKTHILHFWNHPSL